MIEEMPPPSAGEAGSTGPVEADGAAGPPPGPAAGSFAPTDSGAAAEPGPDADGGPAPFPGADYEKPRPGRLRLFALILAGLVLLAVVAVAAAVLSLPDIAALKSAPPQTTAMMKYREAEYRQKGRKIRQQYAWVPLGRISSYLREAVLIAEDDKFFQHQGFDWEEMQKSFEKNREKGKVVRGGSTITQQLAKNLYLNPSRTPWRKLREALIARQIEKELPKRRILELYLNVIEWGDHIYGVEAASRHYFAKSAAALTPGEAIRLASVIINPRRYSPVTDTNKRMRSKRLLLASRMYQRQLFDEDTYRALTAEFSGE